MTSHLSHLDEAPIPHATLQRHALRAWSCLGPMTLLVALAACRSAPPPPDRPLSLASSGTAIPAGPLGASIRRGRALLVATRDSLPGHVGNGLRCVSCHLDEGRRPQGTWVGVYARYPQYRTRTAAVQTIEGRINDCFERSLNGTALPFDGRDMTDIVAYLWWLSQGSVVGSPAEKGADRFAGLAGDTIAGKRLFAATCATCHGPAGGGTSQAPPLWGDRSFSIGAGMARSRTAAEFIRANMPFTTPGTLTDQQALDVATYITSERRPDFPAKVDDWPRGGAPADLPYSTRAGSNVQK